MICLYTIEVWDSKYCVIYMDWENRDLEICALLNNMLDHARPMFHSTFSIYVSIIYENNVKISMN